MTLADQQRWLANELQRKREALTNPNCYAKWPVIEADQKALEAIALTVRLHVAMRDAIETVKRMPQTAAHLQEQSL